MFGLFKAKNKTQSYAITHIGDRDENQDSYESFLTGNLKCYIVADGMGGHKGGLLASSNLCKAIKEILPQYGPELKATPKESINALITQARDRMCSIIHKHDTSLKPHTTLVLAIYQDSSLYLTHVGDSRAYLIQNNKISWQSRDHSVAQLMVEEGELKAEDAMHDESQNLLYRSVECNKEHQASFSQFDGIKAEQHLLLCSDGFWRFITEKEILSLAQSSNPQLELKKYVKKVLKLAKGGSDNITAVLIKL